MKMTPEHFEILKTAIEKIISIVNIPVKAYTDQNLSEMRYRWDMLYVCGRREDILPKNFVTDVLYKYIDDTHIDTALRKITNTK